MDHTLPDPAALPRWGFAFLRRLRGLGARTCHVETGDMGPANALYRSIPFTEEYRGHTWRRDLGMAW